MFFTISHTQQTNFNNFYQLGSFIVSTDNGWHYTNINQQPILYKGYVDVGIMEDLLPSIIKQQEPVYSGNFCVIVLDSDNNIQIKSDRDRGFPIFIQDQQYVSNITKGNWTAWTDSLITIQSDLTVSEKKFDLINSIDLTELSEDEVVNRIDTILTERTKNFLKYNQLPIRAHLSGGVDSLLVYSYLQKHTDRYELIKCQHIDYDYFWLMNSGTLKQQFWGYNQIHHWSDPCVLTSGAPGDEFMLRSPVTSNLWLQFHGIHIIDLLTLPEWQHCLHQDYFTLPKNYKVFKEQQPNPKWDLETLSWNICNILANDWQHWHLGNTLTWTPLRDMEIFKLFLRLPIKSQIGQIMDSTISLRLIELNAPRLSKLISNQKNSGNVLSNLTDFLLK